MRVLLVNRFFGGAQTPTGRMLADVAEALVAGGHHVEVLTSRGRYAGEERGRAGGVVIHRVPTAHAAGRTAAWATFLAGARVRIPALAWDRALVLTDPPFLIAAARKGRSPGRRLFWWTMDLYPEALVARGTLQKEGILTRALRSINDRAIRRLDGVVALGPRQADRLRTYPSWPSNDGSFLLVEPPWDLRAEPAGPRAANRFVEAHGLGGRRIALYAGNLGEAHAFEEIVGAARHLASDPTSRWSFVFVVRGARRGRLERATRGLPNVIVTGYVPADQTADLLAAADVHLITMRPGWDGVVVPSKLYGVLPSPGRILFIGPPGSETALDVARYDAGTVLPPASTPDAVIAALDALHARTPAPREVDGGGPERVARFITRDS